MSSHKSHHTPPEPGSRLDRIEARVEAWLQRFWARWNFWFVVAGGLALLVFIFYWPSILVTVRSGEQGVLFRRFGQGTITDKTYGEGLHFILPWDTLYIYNVRIQQRRIEFQVLTLDGLQVSIDVSVRYHPRIEQVGLLHKRVGPDYFDTIIRPGIVSKMRTTAGGLNAEEIYSTKRSVLEQATRDAMRQLDDSYLILDELLIEQVILPENLQISIQNKENAEQVMLEYDYRLKTEVKEAERKRIEAQGVRDFQDIISKGISEQLLRWRGIEATLALAKSENAKVVVIGGGRDGLPLILDTNTQTPARAAPAPASPTNSTAPAAAVVPSTAAATLSTTAKPAVSPVAPKAVAGCDPSVPGGCGTTISPLSSSPSGPHSP
ncbi:hypothetical protein CYFUS_007888 [Cystobacter fuscus]|uniref:Band 7 domain-containing protein n=1 Tax=Cystobacter fuscus TaxID=43 RepID=A0A250JFM8_9BACT|nr:prohibitin family protein [Cystobacter fuscus]ATB42410.1 hypothetical protein CYFUS_007888 [Cystobacter fuscus]